MRMFHVALLLIALLPVSAAAQLVVVPPGLSPGEQYRLAFLTSTSTMATSSDISYYNNFVTDVANSVPQLAALQTTWMAAVSTAAIDAVDNTDTRPNTADPSVPIYGLGGGQITANNETLWNTFADLPNGTDELGHYAGDELFWTGSNSGLRVAGLTLGSTPSAIAISPIYDAGVFEGFNLVTLSTTSLLPVAAVSGVLTVPVPEPSSLALAFLAATGLAVPMLRQRKR